MDMGLTSAEGKKLECFILLLKNKHYLHVDQNFDHQMSLSKKEILKFQQLFIIFETSCSIVISILR